MWTWLTALALAAPPAGVRPVLAPLDAPDQYAEYMRTQGRSEVLACESFWPDAALMCWKTEDGRWVTRSDLRTWQTTHEALVELATARAQEVLAAGWTEVRVEGIEGSYYTAPDPDGLAHSAVLVPDVLREISGSQTPYVSVPVDGVVLVWKPGHPELDHAIAVGARKMFDESSAASTPVVFQYTGRWSAFAEATRRATP